MDTEMRAIDFKQAAEKLQGIGSLADTLAKVVCQSVGAILVEVQDTSEGAQTCALNRISLAVGGREGTLCGHVGTPER